MRLSNPRDSHGMTTHLRTATPAGRVVRFADGTWVCVWEDEHRAGRRASVRVEP